MVKLAGQNDHEVLACAAPDVSGGPSASRRGDPSLEWSGLVVLSVADLLP